MTKARDVFLLFSTSLKQGWLFSWKLAADDGDTTLRILGRAHTWDGANFITFSTKKIISICQPYLFKYPHHPIFGRKKWYPQFVGVFSSAHIYLNHSTKSLTLSWNLKIVGFQKQIKFQEHPLHEFNISIPHFAPISHFYHHPPYIDYFICHSAQNI